MASVSPRDNQLRKRRPRPSQSLTPESQKFIWYKLLPNLAKINELRDYGNIAPLVVDPELGDPRTALARRVVQNRVQCAHVSRPWASVSCFASDYVGLDFLGAGFLAVGFLAVGC